MCVVGVRVCAGVRVCLGRHDEVASLVRHGVAPASTSDSATALLRQLASR